jgi:hypothetical protein
MMTNKSIRLPPKTGKELMDIIALRCDFHLQNLRNAVKYGAKGVIRPGKLFSNINATIESFVKQRLKTALIF